MDRISPTRRDVLKAVGFGSLGLIGSTRRLSTAKSATVRKPNVVIVLADDLGYGDLTCYNEKSLISTPNADRVAQQGIRFTDAHTPSSVCTPTRTPC